MDKPMPNLRRVRISVLCATEDADEVRDSLRSWYSRNDLTLATLGTEISEPTPDELAEVDLDCFTLDA